MGHVPGWEIVKTDAGHHAVFKAANGEVMLTSEVYANSTIAHDAIRTVENLIVRLHVEGQTLPVSFNDETAKT